MLLHSEAENANFKKYSQMQLESASDPHAGGHTLQGDRARTVGKSGVLGLRDCGLQCFLMTQC